MESNTRAPISSDGVAARRGSDPFPTQCSIWAMASIFFFSVSRLKEPGVWLGGYP